MSPALEAQLDPRERQRLEGILAEAESLFGELSDLGAAGLASLESGDLDALSDKLEARDGIIAELEERIQSLLAARMSTPATRDIDTILAEVARAGRIAQQNDAALEQALREGKNAHRAELEKMDHEENAYSAYGKARSPRPTINIKR